jgi:chromosome segregation ATPase
LELAATIGKQLLEKDQQLEIKIEFLELQLEKSADMVNQLRYDISLKDNLLKTFLDSEYEDAQRELDEHAGAADKRKPSAVNVEILNEYKKKIEYLENENDMLRNKADFFEKETSNLEARESATIGSYIRECESSQARLRSAQDELKSKAAECLSQQEEIQNLFSQIFELQLRVKSIAKENIAMHELSESSKIELLDQINELKEKYNECLSLLNKTQEELAQLRRKAGSGGRSLTAKTAASIHSEDEKLASREAATASSVYIDDDETSTYDLETSFKPSVFLNNKHSSMYSPWMTTNSNSLAAELFSSMAKEFRFQNTNMPQQVSQSSDFIRKVKQKLTKTLPGSSNIDSMQSDSEVEMMLK